MIMSIVIGPTIDVRKVAPRTKMINYLLWPYTDTIWIVLKMKQK